MFKSKFMKFCAIFSAVSQGVLLCLLIALLACAVLFRFTSPGTGGASEAPVHISQFGDGNYFVVDDNYIHVLVEDFEGEYAVQKYYISNVKIIENSEDAPCIEKSGRVYKLHVPAGGLSV